MAKKSRDEFIAEETARRAEVIEWNRTTLPFNALLALAQAYKLGLGYYVSQCGSDAEGIIKVTICATKHDLGYDDEQSLLVYKSPSETDYAEPWHMDALFNLNNRVMEYKAEQKRLAEVKRAALAKLSDEEKQVLGLK
jgi:hypothetical protein